MHRTLIAMFRHRAIKRSFGFFIAFWFSAVIVRPSVFAAGGELVYDVVHSPGLEGNLLGDSADRSVIVYLPPSYGTSPERRYPVVYLLHAYSVHNTSWVEGTYQGFNIKAAMDTLVAEGKVSEMVVVMPDAYNAYGGSFYTNSSVTGNWEDFITQDLVHYIDRTYRTLSQAASRGVVGHSMGGYGAIMLGMKHPEIYSAMYGMSASLGMAEIDLQKQRSVVWSVTLDLENMDQLSEAGVGPRTLVAIAAAFSPNPDRPPFYVDFPVQWSDEELTVVDSVAAKWAAHSPLQMFDQYISNLLKMRGIGLDVGTEDQFTVIPITTRAFDQALTDAGISHVFEEYDGDHVNCIRERMETKVLPFFSEVLAFEMLLVDTNVPSCTWGKIKGDRRE